MGLSQYLRMLWVRRGVIFGTTLAGLLVGVVAFFAIAPVYQATSRMVMDIIKPDPVTGDVVASAAAKAFVSTQIQLIKDYRVAGAAVDRLGLANSAAERRRFEAAGGAESTDFRRWLAQNVIARTDAKLVENSNIVEITYSANSSDAARAGADALRDAYIQQTVAYKRNQLGSTYKWFDQQTELLKSRLAEAERKKADFERENGIVLDQNAEDMESERLKALAAAGSVPAPASVVTGGGGANPALAQLDAQIANLSSTLGPNHPDLVALRQQRAAMASSASAASGAVRVSAPNVAGLYSAQMRKVLAQRGLMGEAQRLTSEVGIARDLYVKTAARAAELRQQAQSNEAGIDPLGDAVSPERPLYPSAPLTIGLGVLFGLGLGVIVALAIELINRTVRSPQDLAMENLNVIGAMPEPRVETPDRSLLYLLGFKKAKQV